MEGNDFYFLNNKTKTTPIENDYRISNNVLGLGINGKVVQCFSIKTGQKFALKVIFDRYNIFLICCSTCVAGVVLNFSILALIGSRGLSKSKERN